MTADPILLALLIFAAVAALQLPGKSNFGVITLATRHPAKDVFVGASLGLGVATAVSVSIGYGAETVLGPYLTWVKVVGGIALIAFGVREIARAPAPVHEPGEGTPQIAQTARQVRSVAFGLAFLLEMGDNTQILSILFVASTHNVLLVYVAATAALVTVTALSSHAARYLREHVPEEHLRVVLGTLLIAVGALTIVLSAYPTILPISL